MRLILKKAAANALIIVLWLTGKSIRSDDHQCGMKKNDHSRAKDCQVHAVRGSRAN